MSDEQPGRRNMRRHRRETVELPVVVTDTANRVVGGIRFHAGDVSPGGAFLRSDLLFEVGEVLDLEFQIPGRLIKVKGKVVRVSRETGQDRFPGMGIEFQSLPKRDLDALVEHLGRPASAAAES